MTDQIKDELNRWLVKKWPSIFGEERGQEKMESRINHLQKSLVMVKKEMKESIQRVEKENQQLKRELMSMKNSFPNKKWYQFWALPFKESGDEKTQ